MGTYDEETRSWTCPDCGVSHSRPGGVMVLTCVCGRRAVWIDTEKDPIQVVQRPNGPRMSCPHAEVAYAEGADVHLE